MMSEMKSESTGHKEDEEKAKQESSTGQSIAEASSRPKDASQQQNTPVPSSIVPLFAERTESITSTAAVGLLYEKIKEKFEDSEYFTLTMHIKTDGSSEVIPIPEKNNIRKMKENFGRLPKRVPRTLKKTIREEHWNAVQELYDYLETSGNQALGETEKPLRDLKDSTYRELLYRF